MRLAPGSLVGQLLDFNSSRDFPVITTQAANGQSDPFTPGGIIWAYPTDGIDTASNVPNWGACALMYVVNTASTTYVPGTLVTWNKNFLLANLASTANTGAPLGVVVSNFGAGNTTRQGGWILRAGICPVTYSVAATTGAMYVGTSGNATPTAANGKQIVGGTCLIADTGAFTRTVQTTNGSTLLRMSRVNGIYIGMAVSGTGIPGSTTVSSIGASGIDITMSAAATATASVTGTFTNTGYGICSMNWPSVQTQAV